MKKHSSVIKENVMKKCLSVVLSSIAVLACTQFAPTSAAAQSQQMLALPNAAPLEMPTHRSEGKHVNRAIDLLADGQPIYYTSVSSGEGDESGFETGRQMADTSADYILYEMEHGVFDFSRLRGFMQGLVDAGPTPTGHRTPPVIVTLPVQGTTDAVRANAWMFQQALAAGVHGILLVHAESPDAVEEMIKASRYPFAPQAVGLPQGYRGSGSQRFAAEIWGLTPSEYMRVADPWPLNPNGELMFGIKIENPRADVNAESLVRVPGLTFAEWGPGDNSFWIVGFQTGDEGVRRSELPVMKAVRARVLAATKAADIFFLNACNEDTVIDQIDDGVMICTGGESPAAAKGREYTNREDST